MVVTASSGNSPIAVSSESITASAPSKTAVATSEASARVGRGACTIDSSICVATMTGLPAARHASTSRRCVTGTVSADVSTPRSPRATITASASATMAWSAKTASYFSTFATIGIRRTPMASRSRTMSSGARTNDCATKSIPAEMPQARSSRSLGVTASTESRTPGTFTPLFEESGPPRFTMVSTRRSPECSTASSIEPSSMRMRSPADTSSAMPWYVTHACDASPSHSSHESMNVAPSTSTVPGATSPTRILGPPRSSITAT